MAHTLSAVKRLRQSRARNERNKSVKSAVRTQVKKAQEAISKKDAAGASDQYREACRLLDKAVSKGVLHPNNAARRKSRLAMRFNAASKSSTPPTA
jgi:small subunit ribosomal protein S20